MRLLRLLARWALVGVVAGASFGTRAAAQDAAAGGAPDSADVARLALAVDLLERFGAQTWPGWGPQPLLVRDGERDLLLGHPSPPRGFEPLEGVTVAGRDGYARSGHVVPVPAATTWLVGTTWSVAVPVLDEFQAAIDAVLGPSVVVLDDAAYVRAVVHEAFHAFQLTTVGGPDALPERFAATDAERALPLLRADAEVDEEQAVQGRALVRALTATTDAGARAAAAEFLRLRQDWRLRMPDGVASFVEQVEWVEGVARYADTSLLMRGFAAADGRSVRGTWTAPDAVWSEFLGQVGEPRSIPGGVRDRLYVSGAAQAFLLDRFVPDWKGEVLPGGCPLETLLRHAVDGGRLHCAP